MAVAIPIIIILVVAVGTMIVLVGEPSARRTPARCRARRSSATRQRRPGRGDRCRPRPSSRRPDANAPTTRAPPTRTFPPSAGAATSSSGNRSTRKSSASPAGSSSTAASVGVVGFSVAGFGAACLGFLWPTGSAGFGGKIARGQDQRHHRLHPVATRRRSTSPKRAPTSCSTRRSDLPAAKKVYSPITYAGMEQGFVALYQRCVHLGCRVPWCQSSQWFECPCHGSKYNRVGEKKAGPAPRGLDRFAIIVGGGTMTINTGDIETRAADRHQHDRTATGRPALRLISTHRRQR